MCTILNKNLKHLTHGVRTIVNFCAKTLLAFVLLPKARNAFTGQSGQGDATQLVTAHPQGPSAGADLGISAPRTEQLLWPGLGPQHPLHTPKTPSTHCLPEPPVGTGKDTDTHRSLICKAYFGGKKNKQPPLKFY